MKILILGGTGVIGESLAEVLGKAGVYVYVTSRAEHFNHNNIYYIKGDAKNLVFLSSVLSEKWDAVVDFMNYTIDELKERIGFLLDNTKCYYFLSSSRVYADSKDKPILEESPLLKDTAQDQQYLLSKEYGLAKAEEECIIKSSGKANWVIFRPYIIYGNTRFQLGDLEKEDWLYRVLKGKSIILQSSLVNKRTTLTFSYDAAQVMSSIILSGQHNGDIFNIVGDKTCSMTWGEIAEIYRNLLEKCLRRKITIKYYDDAQARKLRKGTTYYQTTYDRMFYRVFDNTKIHKYKDIHPYLSIRDGLDICLNEFFRRPHFNYTNYAQEALIDRFTGEHSNILHIPKLKNKFIYLYYRFIKTN